MKSACFRGAGYGTDGTDGTNATSALTMTAAQGLPSQSHGSHESHKSYFPTCPQDGAEPISFAEIAAVLAADSAEDELAILLKYGGYRHLLTYKKSHVIFLGTAIFVQRFFDPKDRTIDQMFQAARSGKQNIIEGSKASGISKETELKLTGVARASLEELLEDYYDFLAVRGFPLWAEKGVEAAYIGRLARATDNFEYYRPFFETRDGDVCANIMICLIHKCNYLLDRQLKRLESDFVKLGGLRERMTRARLKYRDSHKGDAKARTAAQGLPRQSHLSHKSHESHFPTCPQDGAGTSGSAEAEGIEEEDHE